VLLIRPGYFSNLSTGYLILDIRYWIHDAGYWSKAPSLAGILVEFLAPYAYVRYRMQEIGSGWMMSEKSALICVICGWD